MSVLYNPGDAMVDTFNKMFTQYGIAPIAKTYGVVVEQEEDEGTPITVWVKNPIDGGEYASNNNSKLKGVQLGYKNLKPF